MGQKSSVAKANFTTAHFLTFDGDSASLQLDCELTSDGLVDSRGTHYPLNTLRIAATPDGRLAYALVADKVQFVDQAIFSAARKAQVFKAVTTASTETSKMFQYLGLGALIMVVYFIWSGISGLNSDFAEFRTLYNANLSATPAPPARRILATSVPTPTWALPTPTVAPITPTGDR